MNWPGLRRVASFGTGVGVVFGASDLEVAVVRVRPTGARLAGALRITGFRERPAAEWGREVADFLKKFSAEKQAAVAVLPRRDTLLRLLTLPGLSNEDTEAAVRFQLDTLHPYGEEEVLSGWKRLNTATVAVGIAERRHVETAAALCAEAGLRLAGVSFSGPVLHAALRVAGAPPAELLAAWPEDGEGLELYGESPARPLFSAEFDMPAERAEALVRAELRVTEGLDVRPVEDLFPWATPAAPTPDGQDDHAPPPSEAPPAPSVSALAQAAALAAACPHIDEPLNLLPAEQRASSSRARYVPALVLSVLLLGVGGALLAQESWLDRRYLDQLTAEIRKLEPAVARVQALDAETAELAERIAQLDAFRKQTRADLQVIREINRLVESPGWVQQLQITRDNVQVAGEATGAEGLLKEFDESPQFRGAAFTMPLTRGQNGDMFRLRAEREGAPQ